MPEGKQEVVYSGMRHAPSFYIKLFSLTSVMKKVAKIISEGMQLIMKNGPVTLTFQQCLETTSSFVLGLKIKPKVSEFSGYMGKIKNLMWQNGMDDSRHVSKDVMHHMANYYGKTIHKQILKL